MSSTSEPPPDSDPGSLPSPDGKTDESFAPVFGNETIYEVFGQISGQNRLDSPTSHVVSERVQNLASQIYTELQKIICRCSDDEEVVGGLMPLIVNVLEALDLSIIESQQLQVELELCKDDNEQLVAAFDKEKASKKRGEQKLLEYEFQAEEEKQQFTQKIMSLENIVKMLELKSKNVSDHSMRLEEKENELKVENTKLHSRYNELLRSHCDLMERTKILMTNDDQPMSLGPQSLGFSANLKPIPAKKTDLDSYSCQMGETLEANQRGLSSTNLIPRQAWVDADLSLEDASIIEDIDDIPRDRERFVDRDRDTQSITGQSINNEQANDNFFGMEKEVQNLIKENDELLATKNALNIVKDDLITKVDELQSDLTISREEVQQLTAVKDKLKSRISSMEKELKDTKEQLTEAIQKVAARMEDDEEVVPMGQRKRFTRLEMAKVLKERNHYKEKLIELQEAIRWTQVIRENKAEGEKRSAIWKFFSNLFSTSGSTTTNLNRDTQKSPTKPAAIRYDPSNPAQVAPVFDIIKRKPKGVSGDLVLLSDNNSGDKSLKNVQAHVNRVNGDRIMAYGWSIAGGQNDSSNSNSMVPIPIYCRPLSSDDMGMKIWCAAAVDLTGGEAEFPGNSIMSRSESQHRMSHNGDKKGAKDEESLNITEAESDLGIYSESSNFPDPKKLSTFAWICSVSHSRSKVSVVNIKSNPSELLDSFTVRTHLLCIASVPGAKNDDIHGFDLDNMCDIKLVQVNEESETSPENEQQQNRNEPSQQEVESTVQKSDESEDKTDKNDSIAKEIVSSNDQLEKIIDYVAYTEPPSPSCNKNDGRSTTSVYQPLSTCLPTMWLGGQNGVLYVHSGLAQWSHCIFRVKLPDSILQIAHFKGRVFVALANGQCCVFARSLSTGCWDFSKYVILDLGSINSHLIDGTPSGKTGTSNAASSHGIRCMEVTKTSIWLGYRNIVFILDCNSLKIDHHFAVDSRRETQVRQLTAMEDGVWCSIRLDSTIRLYSTKKPYQHIQDIDIEPHVTKLLGAKSFSFVRITSLKASNNRLWIGLGSGMILSIPCDSNTKQKSTNADLIVPKCNSSQAQLSYHGHKDAVKFFVMAKNLIMSGGEGYIDFRLNPEEETTPVAKADRSHLIVWESDS